ncbi:MAG: type II toxin-antitoxin system HicA family toxin [Haloferacaceae archaeon]
MPTRDFSGDDVIAVLCNVGPFRTVNVTGSHAKLRCDPPAHHNTEPRVVTVPRTDRIPIGTLQSIADQAGANDFEEFCAWIDRNR